MGAASGERGRVCASLASMLILSSVVLGCLLA